RGGIAGFLFGAAVLIILNILLNKKYVVSKIKILFACCILCFVATGLIVVMTQHYQRGYDYERVLLVQSSYKMWNDHKLYGVGYSRWQKEYKEKYISPEAKEPDLPMPHNTFAEYFSTTGVIGGLGYSIFVFGSIIILIKKMKEDITNPYIQALLWVSISILAHGLVDAGLRNKFVARLYFGFWGITLASVYNWTYWKSQFFQCKEMIIKK
ncbi:O-antigen ligase domain-containing protein, partial [Megasphaera sp. SW808]|uniref:O-antigen ligase family protein n=1 Tax=Megasphaera sp. SW808 TaxID=2530045 RepID=UPI00143AA2E1